MDVCHHRAIYEILVHRLSDFGEFGRQVRAYLERESAGCTSMPIEQGRTRRW